LFFLFSFGRVFALSCRDSRGFYHVVAILI
jgi:hypothetical protein